MEARFHSIPRSMDELREYREWLNERAQSAGLARKSQDRDEALMAAYIERNRPRERRDYAIAAEAGAIIDRTRDERNAAEREKTLRASTGKA